VTVSGFTYNASITDENCGAADGEIDLTAVGGMAAFVYSIDNGATTQGTGLFTGLTNGNYDILITDANGCQANGTEIVGNLSGPTINSIVATDPSCAGVCDGEITITVAGGTMPYSYQWYDALGAPIGPNAATITGLCADDYSVEVTDASGGSTLLNTNGDFEIGPGGGCDCPPGFVCNNDAGQVFDGSMPVYTVGDQGCVSSATNYANSLGANSGTGYVYFYAGADNISTGPFAFVGGETVEICVWYAGPQGAGASGQNTANSHFSLGVDGVSVSPDVLVPTNTGWTQYCFTVVMTPGNHTFEILSGGAAQYSMWFDDFTITDISGGGGGCPAMSNATLSDPAIVDASFTLTDFCEDEANSATGIITPGGSFSYNPNPGDGSSIDPITGEITNGVIGTTYTVEYNTGGTCPEISTNTVTVNGFTYNSVITDENCGSGDGEIDLTTVGGSPAFTFSIDNGVTSQAGGLFSNLSSAVYDVIITDNNGCQASGVENVGNIGGPSIDNAIVVDETCLGNSDGSIDVNMVSGGSGTYDYSWDIVPDPTVASVTNLPPGTYTITVTDQVSGCSVQAVYDIVAGPICCNIVIDTLSTTAPTCGQSDGEIIATAVGGTGVYSFSINNGPFVASGTFSSLSSGSYEIVVTDDLGVCSDTIDVQLSDLGSPSIDLVSSVDVLCFGGLDGEIDITASGGTGVLDYEITDGAAFTDNNGTGSFIGIVAGTYTITVTDQNNCQVIDNIQIFEPTEVQADIVTLNIDCFGGLTGEIDITGSGGTPGYSYSIDNGLTWIANGSFTGLGAQNYDVLVQDANGCLSNGAVVSIVEPSQLVADVLVTNESCFGDCDGTLSWAGAGGTPTYSFAYSGINASGATVNGLCPGTINYTLTDSRGCSINGSIDIIPAIELVPGAIVVTDDGCTDECDGTITLDSNTGVQYTLNGVMSPAGNFTDLCSGFYTITIEDANGCSVDVNANVLTAEQTIASFSYSPGYVTVFDNEIQLSNTSTNGDSFIWNITGPNGFVEWFDYDITSIQLPADSGSYNICLTSISASGCEDTYCAPIVVHDAFSLYVPNAFTPDGDEFNQTFMAYVNGVDVYDFEMLIFNRWGELVWESHDPSIGWDGTYKGKTVQEGVYTWKIVVKDLYIDDRQVFTGHVSILK